MSAFAILGTLFVIGEAMTDPGGFEGVLLASTWVVPLGAVIALIVWAPAIAARVLTVAVLAASAFSASYLLAPDAWRDFEDTHGPVRAIALFAVTVAITLLGYRPRYTRQAGVLLIIAALLPAAMSIMAGQASPSLMIVSPVPLGCALLYLLAASMEQKPETGPTAD